LEPQSQPPDDARPGALPPLLLLLSLVSGAAAITYEIVWFQLLELVIGSSAVSIGVLLATFMGGTCLGSLMLPRLISMRRNTLRVYAGIEACIGILAVLELLLMPFAGRVYTAWSGYGVSGFLLRGAVAAMCLLPPTLLMGATFPALARSFRTTRAGVTWIGFLYAANIAGAVGGSLLASFYLLRLFDVTTATCAAAALNAAGAIGAVALSRTAPFNCLGAAKTAPEFPSRAAGAVAPASERAVYVAIALSGFCALAAEAIWTRILGLLLGASVYTFSIVVAAFLAGLGGGSGIGSMLSRNLKQPRLALGWCQLLLAGAIAWSAYVLAGSLPYGSVDSTIPSNVWFNFELDLGRTLWALLPPTLLWGASFPLALAAVTSAGQDGARLAAGVYASNTLGAIAGALAGSLLLIARAGSQHAEQLLISLSTAAALVLLLRSPGPRWRAAGFAVVLSGAAIYSIPPVPGVLIAHGRYAASWLNKSEIVYAREGMNSSVAVSRFPSGAVTFHVAGKIQASTVPRDMRLQRMLGHLTTLMAGNPRSVLVIGCGAGITAGAVSIDPRVEQETIAEIEPLVPQAASAFFGEQNFDVLHNAKVRVRIDDGRHYLLTTKERFDGITVDPLDPWVKGAANLYTKEFYEAMKRRLNPGGVVTMYVQLFETNLEAVKSSLATFFEVFPNGTVWGNPYEGKGHDMVLLGQAEPLRIDLDAVEEGLRRPEYAAFNDSLAEVGIHSSVELFATYAGRASDLKPWLEHAQINGDGNLRMQYLAGLSLNLDDSAAIYSSMLAHRRFPEDSFSSAEGRVHSLRLLMQRGE
jgi:spermidine synthase